MPESRDASINDLYGEVRRRHSLASKRPEAVVTTMTPKSVAPLVLGAVGLLASAVASIAIRALGSRNWYPISPE